MYVNETNLEGKLREKLGGTKNLGGHGPPWLPLRIATDNNVLSSFCTFMCKSFFSNGMLF